MHLPQNPILLAAPVYRTAFGILGNESDAQDASQNVFLYLLRKPSSLRRVSVTGAWLHTAAANAAVSILRTKSRQLRQEGAVARERMKTVHEDVGHGAAHEATPHLRRLVADLPEKLRTVVTLHYFQGLSCTELADVVPCSVSAATTRLERARAKLRGRMSGAGLMVVLPLEEILSSLPADMPSNVQVRSFPAQIVRDQPGLEALGAARRQ